MKEKSFLDRGNNFNVFNYVHPENAHHVMYF